MLLLIPLVLLLVIAILLLPKDGKVDEKTSFGGKMRIILGVILIFMGHPIMGLLVIFLLRNK